MIKYKWFEVVHKQTIDNALLKRPEKNLHMKLLNAFIAKHNIEQKDIMNIQWKEVVELNGDRKPLQICLWYWSEQ